MEKKKMKTKYKGVTEEDERRERGDHREGSDKVKTRIKE